MRLFENGSCWGFTYFFIPILSQTVVASALIRLLKLLILFKVILDFALLTSTASCLSRNASADRSGGIGSFWGIFSSSFSGFVKRFVSST